MITVTYDTFFNRYYENIRAYIWKIVNNWEDSEELALDAFMHVFEIWGTFNSIEHAQRILYICAKNLSFNHLEKQGRQKRGHPVELKPWIELEDVEVVEIAFYDIMCGALHCVHPKAKEVFLMFMQGMTKAEISDTLGVTPNTVKNHRAHAIKSIQSFIKNKVK